MKKIVLILTLIIIFNFAVTGCCKENDDINIESKSHNIIVLDNDGNPVSGVKINFTTSDKSENGVVSTDKNGCINHPVMYPNAKYTYTLSDVSDLYFVPKPVEISANTNAQYCIVLKKAKHTITFVVRHNSEPVKDEEITLMDNSNNIISTILTGEDGSTSIVIDTGTYSYKVSSASDEDVLDSHISNFSVDTNNTIIIDK